MGQFIGDHITEIFVGLAVLGVAFIWWLRHDGWW
jgi:hypothetical protein